MAEEKKYQKLTQIEHILKRPDTYVGTIEETTEDKWIWNNERKRLENKKITYVPALYKIFDEILVNAIDNI